MKSLGIHHISALVSDIHRSFDFYHDILGLNLLMKTVNQDDTTMYHLFFSDMQGRPGTEFTVFQINTFRENTFGTNAIERAVFSVQSEESLAYWIEHLDKYNIEHCGIENYGESKIIRFEDPDGMNLGISYLENSRGLFYPKLTGSIPSEHGIIGLHSVHLRLRYPKATEKILTEWFDFTKINEVMQGIYPVTMLKNNNSELKHEIHLIEDTESPLEIQGIGGIHHLALYVSDYTDLLAINEKIINRNFSHSGIQPREFFDATYFREPNNLLFEVASKIKKVPTINDVETIDESPLYLPDFLEEKRESITSELAKLERYKESK